ncbi:haloacid dehalogenase-like hydrolase [uncultured Paludibaculum sp.]|uniref:haloacid dehalogenase-like hydrolase n=1 Tax=uncultured Paludibaculum sp. TaxID=1765020 RepID=UPI002AAA7AAC|nr:haloacid dehalogenase-like hydrolase [uncultured Paludibaculum sp.]
MASSVLITDFDGTISRVDFYELALEHCLAAALPDYWAGYSSGRLTHFEAMAAIYAQIRCSESTLRSLLPRMQVDPQLPTAVRQLHDSGWDIAIVSNGSNWYIDQLLASLGLGHLEVHSNPGRFVEGSGLLLDPPLSSPFYNREYGIDKSAVVRDALKRYDRVAFAGNGPPDERPALLVDPALRFATGWLAGQLKRRKAPFHPFRIWSEIAATLSAAAPLP